MVLVQRNKTSIIHANINNHVVQPLLAEARKDGMHKLTVGAVIKRDGKFLLLERAPSDFMGGLVELPSGTVDAGEELLSALARETREETGLAITSILAYVGSFDYRSRTEMKTRQFNFLVAVASGHVKLSPTEHRTRHFVAPTDEEFSALNISDAIKAVLMTAQKLNR